MEPQSPPKRMTRARAAAKAGGDSAAPSRATAATASSRARTSTSAPSRLSSATTTTASAAAKRKLRADDVDTDNDQDELGLDRPPSAMHKVARVVRGRPKKVATAPELAPAPAPATRPRGRPPAKKAAIPDAARPSSRLSSTSTTANTSTTTATAAARAARAKKAAAAAEDTAAEDTEGPAKKRVARTRVASATAATTASSNGAASSSTASAPTKISVRSASVTMAAKASAPSAASAASAAAKKKVTFEEPEKENIAPAPAAGKGRVSSSTKVPTKVAATEAAASTAAGLKSKPLRRGAAAPATSTSTSTTRLKSSSSIAKPTDKANAPLSPKKVTQIRMARDYEVESEDELGADAEFHLKPFERSPTKPSMKTSLTPADRNKTLAKAGLDLESASRDITANIASLPAPEFPGGSLLSSPARRPPQSPTKEGIVAPPARRLDGLLTQESVMASTTNGQNAGSTTNNNAGSVLFSPAKRFPVYPKGNSGNGLDDTLRSPMKMSLLQSPAKRPSSPKKAALILQRPELKLPSLEEKTPALAPSPKAAPSPEAAPTPAASEPMEVETEDADETEEEMEDVDEADEADISDDEDQDMGVSDKTESLTQMLSEMASEAAAATVVSDSPTRRRLFTGRSSASPARDVEQEHTEKIEDMDTIDAVDTLDAAKPAETEEAAEAEIEEPEAHSKDPETADSAEHTQPMDIDGSVLDAATVLVAMSPPKLAMVSPAAPSGVFDLRAREFDENDDMDSDDEPTTRLPILQDSTFGTPCPPKNTRSSRTPSSRVTRASMGGQNTAKRGMAASFGFTPLANQLNGWKAHSPTKVATPTPAPTHKTQEVEHVEEDEDAEKTEDEQIEDEKIMENAADAKAEADIEAEAENEVETETEIVAQGQQTLSPWNSEDVEGAEDADLVENMFVDEDIEEPEFDDDVAVTLEDLELAQEANDMSLMEPAEIDDVLGVPEPADDNMSEASQEYGDENAIPIDPALLAENGSSAYPGVPPVTPQRMMTRTFHTVSKVPLKPADDSTPEPVRLRRRSLGASRLPASRRRSSISLGGFNTANNSPSKSLATTPSPSKRSEGGGLTRSATVISYSPTKKDGRRRESRRESLRDSRRKSRRETLGPGSVEAMTETEDSNSASNRNDEPVEINIPTLLVSGPVTPVKSEPVTWSNVGTPARTPRRDMDPALLRGAVVFVDVYTSEGADASAIFIELLAQMGARCVKTWPWSPSDDNSSSSLSVSKPGITHVVFKDGSKRTLEKVRDSNGVVQCVGVSWVLDCERENEWLEEAPYQIDTVPMPRGGGSRRKTMEPQSLANLNGLVVKTPPKQTLTNAMVSARECRTAPTTPMNRRDSALWVRTPEDERSNGDGDNDEDADGYGEPDWTLTPVPKTPAPEVIARYAANVSPSTPYGSDAGSYYGADDDDTTVSSVGYDNQTPLITRTCPPKQRAVSYNELGAGILSREKDQGVLMRLMAARRKSLQFAPKIASPLSKQWREFE
ncbi:signal transducer [Ophiostoma piceae UAMH 11346]|uniref:Signal transducer n=1 Tax=Ophiostoma piceae (strain UAMH 11346) TaxID=1262450 RepID=S3BY78_OPHP1|nr:signal transducer [Ophiostoma piceae UAMH 11346]